MNSNNNDGEQFQMQFSGFSPKAIEYLRNVRDNNSKIWYEEHREDYKKYVRQPFYDLIEDLTPAVREIDPTLITEPAKCLSRIYRDSRFTNDKHLYRDSAWIVFRRPGATTLEGPVFYAEIMRSGARYGMGAYDSSPKTMAALRNFITDSPELFYQAVKPVTDSGLLILGDKYKRTQTGIPEKAVDLGLEEWYRLKNFYVSSPLLPHEAFYSNAIVKEISEKFAVLGPFYKLLLDIENYRSEEQPPMPKSPVTDFEW